MTPASTSLESRAERRKRETRERLLAAALRVFVERGFDGATTAEMATVADVGAGTFYLHFKDKRDAYETIVRRSAKAMIERWRTRRRAGSSVGDSVALGLETAAEFWAEDLGRARLLLEGGPTFSAAAHVAFVSELAEIIRHEMAAKSKGAPRPSAAVIATVMIGLGIELGRIIVGGAAARETEATIRGTIELARRAFGLTPVGRG